MAAKKNTDLAVTQTTVTNRIISMVNEKAGGKVLMRLSDMDAKPTISTGIRHLDEILNGGIVQGGIVEIFGQAQAGKTALALSIAGQQDNVLYIDGERAITRERAEIYGGHGNYIIDQPNCLEEALEHTIMMVKAGIKLVVLDSLPSLPTRRQMEEKNLDKQAGMALTAGLLSRVLGDINTLLYRESATLIIVNQVRANVNTMSPWAEQYHTFGGLMLPSLAQLRLSVARKRWLKDPALEVYGQEMLYLLYKAKHVQPRRGGEISLVYPIGFVEPEDMVASRAALKILQKEGKYLASSVVIDEPQQITVEEVKDVNDKLDEAMGDE